MSCLDELAIAAGWNLPLNVGLHNKNLAISECDQVCQAKLPFQTGIVLYDGSKRECPVLALSFRSQVYKSVKIIFPIRIQDAGNNSPQR